MKTRQDVGDAGRRVRRVIVVGGGLAGLMTVLRLGEVGIPVALFSVVPVKRSHSVCAQGGINAAIDGKGEGDNPQIHLEETAYGGDFLANQPPIKGMTAAAPELIYLMDRMGVPFNRTPEGTLDFRRFGGSKYRRTAFAGATTGQQLLYALDEQVRALEMKNVRDQDGVELRGEPLVQKFEYWDFLSVVQDEHGVVVGIVAQDLKNMEIRAFRGDAVCLATGGAGMVFGRSTNSLICTGSAAAAVVQQGAVHANGEFVQVHPTAIPGADKLRLISESVRGEGGRVWVPKNPKDPRLPRDIQEKDRDYFLEEKYPAYGNLVPRDIASRELFQVCFHQKRGIFNPKTGKNELEVYLDLTHQPEAMLRSKLASVLEIYEKFVGVDPYRNPMKVFPAAHYTMGGLWVDYEADSSGIIREGSPRNHATSLTGLYAVGEVEYQYHGANRLGANSLLSCLYGGWITGPAIATYRAGLRRDAQDVPERIFEAAQVREQQRFEERLMRNRDGKQSENVFQLHQEMGEMMLRDCTIERHNATLDTVLASLDELEERSKKVELTDRVLRFNQSAQFLRNFEHMLQLARIITRGARHRNESRGAHFKPEFPERDDTNWLKTTLVRRREDGSFEFLRGFDYHCGDQTIAVAEEVDVSLVPPQARTYGQVTGGGSSKG